MRLMESRERNIQDTSKQTSKDLERAFVCQESENGIGNAKLTHKKRTSKLSRKIKGQEGMDKFENVDQDEIASDLRENFSVIKDHFDVLAKVGEGTFSKVYLARVKSYQHEMVAVKHIVPTSSPTRVKNELSCLQCLGGNHNIIGVKTTLRNNDHTAFILPYFKHDKFQTYFRRFTVEEIKDYMRNLFLALKHVHGYNIIHRDVKPSNFLHSRTTNRYSLVDFGLAMQVPGTSGILSEDVSSKPGQKMILKQKSSRIKESHEATKNTIRNSIARGDRCSAKSSILKRDLKTKSDVLCKHGNQPGHSSKAVCTFCCARSGQVAPRAGTPGFRSPEVLMKLPNQTTAVDIWSAGIILLSFLSGRYPFFKAKDDLSSLAQIITVFGSKEASDVGDLLGKDIICSPSLPAYELRSLCERLRQKKCKYHTTKRNKRKYSLRDGASKRARIDKTGDSAGDCCNKLNTQEEGYSIEARTDRLRSNKHESESSGYFSNATQKKTQMRRCNELDSSVESITSHNDCQSNRDNDFNIFKGTINNQALQRQSDNEIKSVDQSECSCIPHEAYDLLSQCLQLNPSTRITAVDALKHCFLIN